MDKWGRLGRAVVALAMVAVLAGACVQRPKEAPATRTIQPMEAINPMVVDPDGIERLGDDGVHTVLALSSGGADGAFGAGVLVGWSERGERPEFDVVTGVSTGALMSVLAFLGPKYDPLLERFYTTVTNRDIFRRRGLDGLFADSLYDYTPLKKQIEEVVTDELLAQVAAEHDRGRRLYVATTNLDAGELVVWDMGRIAKGGRTNKLLHFQKVLRASAAVPGFFPPVYIKPQRGIQLRQSHVDGGVKAPVLVSDAMLAAKDQPKQMFLVVNGNTTRLNASQPVSGELADIARKSIAELMRELMDDTVYRAYVTSANSGAKFHMTAIPDTIPMATQGLDFDPVRMRRLFEAGRKIGAQGPAGWLSAPPRLGRYERVASL